MPGSYQPLRRLAVGGMAEIFLARAEGLGGFDKLCVQKRILPQHASDQAFVRIILDEARLMATLSHPNIAQVYDVGVEAGRHFFTMEYVHGEDLREILRAAGGPLPLGEALGIIIGTAAGLHHAHEARGADGTPLRIVHRDVSPSNVLCGYDGGVKVTDFGVAKWAAQRSETEHGMLKGKVGYMSPEQCRAEPLDRRSDVFALGILLYEATTGRRPFDAESDFEVMNAIVNRAAAPPSTVVPGYPPELEAIVMKALERDRAARHATAEEMQHALEALAAERRLAIGPSALARFMTGLFGGKVTAWERARQQGKTLGQHLQETIPGVADQTRTDLELPAARRRATGTATPSAGTLAARRRSRFLAAAAVVLVLGVAGALAARMRTGEQARVAPPPVAPTPGPSAIGPSVPPRPSPPIASPPPVPGAVAASATSPASGPAKRGRSGVRPRPSPEPGARPSEQPSPSPTAAPPVRLWDPDSAELPKQPK